MRVILPTNQLSGQAGTVQSSPRRCPGLASTLRRISAEFIGDGDDERSAALDLAAAARDLLPLLMPVLEYALRAHLEQQVVRDCVDSELDHQDGSPQCVSFADLVGFTALSEQTHPEVVGMTSEKLAHFSRGVLVGRVRLVKTIGDAVMLTAPTPSELAPVMLDLIDAVREQADLPPVRAGMAYGPALQRAGDLFGRTVNLASRITGHAKSGGLVCDQESYDSLVDDPEFMLKPLEPVVLKGFTTPQSALLHANTAAESWACHAADPSRRPERSANRNPHR